MRKGFDSSPVLQFKGIVVKVSIGPYGKNHKVKVKIDGYDIWNADYTLACVIHPVLVKMKESKHGAPFVDDEDVPDELKSTNAAPKENEWDTDENWFKRWDYVIDEMIWAFAQIIDDKEEPTNYNENSYKTDWDKWNDRCQNGYRLFGKYLRALWT